jgi:putative flavoprotein involved in K+ transport
LPASQQVSPRVRQLHTSEYRNPTSLPDGAVLVVGTGQSGIQIAEELLDHGRRVFICVGKCPRVPRRYRGRDVVRWLVDTGFMDLKKSELPSPAARLACNPQVTGRDGGHDVDVWKLARRGAVLLGRWQRAQGERVHLASDLAQTLAASEQASRKFLDDFDAHIEHTGAAATPPEPAARDFTLPDQGRRQEIDLVAEGIGALIWATGFRPAYPWIEGCAFDADGFPVTDRGVTDSPGLYFVGVHLMHKRKSGLLLGVAEDAEHVAEHIAARMVAQPKAAD